MIENRYFPCVPAFDDDEIEKGQYLDSITCRCLHRLRLVIKSNWFEKLWTNPSCERFNCFNGTKKFIDSLTFDIKSIVSDIRHVNIIINILHYLLSLLHSYPLQSINLSNKLFLLVYLHRKWYANLDSHPILSSRWQNCSAHLSQKDIFQCLPHFDG